MSKFTDENGVWEITSEYSMVLIEPSPLFERNRVVPPPPKSPDTVLKEDLEAATTLVQLKAALLKRFGG